MHGLLPWAVKWAVSNNRPGIWILLPKAISLPSSNDLCAHWLVVAAGFYGTRDPDLDSVPADEALLVGPAAEGSGGGASYMGTRWCLMFWGPEHSAPGA